MLATTTIDRRMDAQATNLSKRSDSVLSYAKFNCFLFHRHVRDNLGHFVSRSTTSNKENVNKCAHTFNSNEITQKHLRKTDAKILFLHFGYLRERANVSHPCAVSKTKIAAIAPCSNSEQRFHQKVICFQGITFD